MVKLPVLVLGVWGDGTSAVTKVIEALGFPAGDHASHSRGPWHIHGVLEDARMLKLLRNEEGHREIRAQIILKDLAKKGAVLKVPWLLIRREYWPTFEPFLGKVVWVTRKKSSKSYHNHLISDAKVAYDELQEQWPGHEVQFEDMLLDPEEETRKLAEFLGVEYRPEAAEFIDPDLPRNKP